MDIDKTTLLDLSIFHQEEDLSIFHRLDFTRTSGGRHQLGLNFGKPLHDINAIKDIQQTVQLIYENLASWPLGITNGTLMVIQKFFEASIDDIPTNPSAAGAYSYKILHGPDFSLVKYSAGHCFEMVKGMQSIIDHFKEKKCPRNFKNLLDDAEKIISRNELKIVKQKKTADEMSIAEMLHFAHFIRYNYKQNFIDLEKIYYQFDAWYSMAISMQKYDLVFPEFIDKTEPVLEAKGLYHLLLRDPVPYNITLDRSCNFLFLTGANMAGKSTFIKATGAAIYIAHLGMPVPSTEMRLTVFDGLLSNINVIDNIIKGESYFFNEVQRIKNTILKINDGKKWLILIDELFKGTNVQDAMKCSTAVIEGLLKIRNSLFILSTHLYEIGDALKTYSNIDFKYFETTVEDEQLKFSYQLKDGISNDRLGYLILKREKVLELLERL